MNYYTYIYYDPIRNNEPIYVGKGKDDRAWAHLSRKDKHPLTHRIEFIKKQNSLPIIGIYGSLTESESFELEVNLIKEFGRKDLGKGPLLNLTDGGEFELNPSPITRDKALKTNKGQKRSEETRRKMSESAKLRAPRSEEFKEKIRQTQKSKPPRSLEIREKIRQGMKNSPKVDRSPKTEEVKEKIRQGMKRYHADKGNSTNLQNNQFTDKY